jgi:hypothetical protein
MMQQWRSLPLLQDRLRETQAQLEELSSQVGRLQLEKDKLEQANRLLSQVGARQQGAAFCGVLADLLACGNRTLQPPQQLADQLAPETATHLYHVSSLAAASLAWRPGWLPLPPSSLAALNSFPPLPPPHPTLPFTQVVLLNTNHEERLHSDRAIMAREQAMLVSELDAFLALTDWQPAQQLGSEAGGLLCRAAWHVVKTMRLGLLSCCRRSLCM